MSGAMLIHILPDVTASAWSSPLTVCDRHLWQVATDAGLSKSRNILVKSSSFSLLAITGSVYIGHFMRLRLELVSEVAMVTAVSCLVVMVTVLLVLVTDRFRSSTANFGFSISSLSTTFCSKFRSDEHLSWKVVDADLDNSSSSSIVVSIFGNRGQDRDLLLAPNFVNFSELFLDVRLLNLIRFTPLMNFATDSAVNMAYAVCDLELDVNSDTSSSSSISGNGKITVMHFNVQTNYSRDSIAQTPTARLPWLIQTCFWVPTKFFQ